MKKNKFKKALSAIIISVLLLAQTIIAHSAPGILATFQTSSSSFSGSGSGTMNDPYLIYDESQFYEINKNPNASYKMMADIFGFRNVSFPIIEQFSGTFDGNGKVIDQVTHEYQYGEENYAIFGSTYNATIKNVTIDEVHLRDVGGDSAGLIGYMEGGEVINCHANSFDVLTGYGVSGVGILVGTNIGGTITYCSTSGRILRNEGIGAIVGFNSGIVENCYSSATYGYVIDAPLVARNTGYVNKCHAGAITNTNTGIIQNSYASTAEPGVQVLTGTQWFQKSSFVNWDFDSVWDIKEGVSRPFLRTGLR